MKKYLNWAAKILSVVGGAHLVGAAFDWNVLGWFGSAAPVVGVLAGAAVLYQLFK